MNVLAAFGDGKAAMNIEGTWALNNMANYFGEEAGNANEWDWVPMPSSDGTAIFDLGMGSTYSINAATEHPEAVADFLTYYFSPEAQAAALVDCSYAPAPVALICGCPGRVRSTRGRRLSPGLPKLRQEGNYGYTTWTFWPPKSDIYIYEEIEKVWAGQMTTEEYLQGLDDLFQEEVDSGRYSADPRS